MKKYILNFCWLGLILLLIQPISAQPANDVDYLSKGRALWNEGKYDSAYVAARKAQVQNIQQEDWQNWGTATMMVGTYLSRKSQYPEAIAVFDSVIALQGRLDSLATPIFFARKELAYMALLQDDLQGSIDLYIKLAADCKRMLPPSADSLLARSYEGLSQAQYYNGDFSTSLQTAKKALGIYENRFPPLHMSIAFCSNTLAIAYMYLGKYEESITYFQNAIRIMEHRWSPTHPQVLQIKTNVGVLYGELGLFWKSLEYHKQIVPYLETMATSPHLNGLLNMGSTLIAVGDYEEAISYLKQAEAFLAKHPNMSKDVFAYLDLHLSIVYQELGETENALKLIERSIKQNIEIYGENNPALVTDYIQQASLLEVSGQLNPAIAVYKKVIQIEKKHIGPHSLRAAHALLDLGKISTQQKLYPDAISRFEAARNMYAAIGNPFGQSQSYLGMATVKSNLNDWEETLAMHQKAWGILMPELPFQLSPDEQVYGYWRLHSLEDLLSVQALNLYTRYQRTTNPTFLRAALASAEAAIAIVDSQKFYYESPVSRQLRVADQLDRYEAAVSHSFELYQLTGEKKYAARAFSLVEKSKAANLRDHVRSVQALAFAGVPDSLVEQERYYRQRLASLDGTRLGGEADSAELAEVQNQHFEMNRTYHSFLHKLEKEYPEYYRFKYLTLSFKADELLRQLDKNQAAYSYFWGEKNVFGFRLYQGDVDFFKVPGDSLLHTNLNQWLAFISADPGENMSSHSQEGAALTQVLLPGLSTDIHHLLILPDGPLGYLPFESLLTNDSPNTSYRDWSFLAKNTSITYAYSGELWVREKLTVSDVPASYVGFAPNFESDYFAETRSDLGSLKHNLEEVSLAAKLLGGKAFNGNQALKSQLKNLKGGPNILHFATHALVDEDHQMNSRLFFSPDTGSSENGILNASEIYGLTLNSPLTVLSACQTGQGKLLRGEGIMSLARAFQYAGSRQVLTTLWQTDDRAGADLTTLFFKGIKAGLSTEIALQEARKSWLASSDNYHCHPYFWSGYVLIGDGGKVPIKQPVGTWVWIILAGVVGLLGLWILRKSFR